MEFSLFLIKRVRYNPATDEYDFLPTIFSADTREEADAIADCLTNMDEEDSFIVEEA